MNIRALVSSVGSRTSTLPIVILYVTAGCNLRCITCSYRDPLPNELSLDEYKDLASQLADLGLRHIVYSGGEPLLRKDFPELCDIFSKLNVRQSLLTNGLLLAKRIDEIGDSLDEIIISLDGPDAATHNRIRGVESFDQIVKGIRLFVGRAERPVLSLRTVVQKANFRRIDDMVEFAAGLGIDRISFLAADVLSKAFHRNHVGSVAPHNEVVLTAEEAREFRKIIAQLLHDRKNELRSRFISDSPSHLMNLAQYFEAFHGLASFPKNSCNAPMVSTVITSTGELLPCYFLPPYGDLRSGPLKSQLNSDLIRCTRDEVRKYSLEQCQKCVCTLKVSPLAALANRF